MLTVSSYRSKVRSYNRTLLNILKNIEYKSIYISCLIYNSVFFKYIYICVFACKLCILVGNVSLWPLFRVYATHGIVSCWCMFSSHWALVIIGGGCVPETSNLPRCTRPCALSLYMSHQIRSTVHLHYNYTYIHTYIHIFIYIYIYLYL